MKESELVKVREKYFELKEENNTLLELEKELVELLNDDKVKRYVELLELIDSSCDKLSEEDIIERAYDNSDINIQKVDSNQIMVYVGTYIKERTLHECNDYVTYESNPNADYKTYLDLETREAFNIKLDKCSEFESEFLTIYIPVSYCRQNEYMRNYFALRKWFFQQLITRSQKEVIMELQEGSFFDKLCWICQTVLSDENVNRCKKIGGTRINNKM